MGPKYKQALDAHRDGDLEQAISLFESLLDEFSEDGKVVYNALYKGDTVLDI